MKSICSRRKKFLIIFILLLMSVGFACSDDDDDDAVDDDQIDDDIAVDDDATIDDDQTDDDSNIDDDATPIDDSELVQYIEESMQNSHIPGLAAAIVIDDEIVWAKGFGWANIAEQRPVTTDTLFMLASVSKTVTATALMQVYDQGSFGLDEDVDGYLDFEVDNPNFQEQPITFRQLLTHTSSIKDNWTVLAANYVQGDSPIALGDYLEGYLVPGGEYYNQWGSYYNYQPGAGYNYSNMGASLVGYLVEAIMATSFDQYCNENLFAPLDMNETSWFLDGLDVSHIAMPYAYLPVLDKFVPYGQYGYPDYPDGQLRTSVTQLANFLSMFMNLGKYEDETILETDTAQLMRQVQYPEIEETQGLIWYYKNLNGRMVLGHNGGDSGVGTEMFFDPLENIGVIIFMNVDWTNDNYYLFQEMEDRLFLFAESIQ